MNKTLLETLKEETLGVKLLEGNSFYEGSREKEWPPKKWKLRISHGEEKIDVIAISNQPKDK